MRATRSAHASMTCSQLSRTSRTWWLRMLSINSSAATSCAARPPPSALAIVTTIASALGGGRAAHDVAAEELIESIRNHHVLLVLDNCEHVIDACADLVARMLQHCQGVHVLATSRQPLGVPGEIVYALEPLS